MSRRPLVGVTFAVAEEDRPSLVGALDGVADVAFVQDMGADERADALAASEALLMWLWDREIRPGEEVRLGALRLVQTVSAGVDALPFDRLPPGVVVAGNAGAYAEPMAEHVVAMTLALAKRLLARHTEMARGEFDNRTRNPTLAGAACGILGFGGIGKATARLMRAFGARIHAINSTGRTDEPVEFAGTLDDLDRVLEASDVLVIALPLTRRTRGLIGARELTLMKPDAILVNVARGAIVDEDALYEHLRTHPGFSAGLDVWWNEPSDDGPFSTRHPFFELPNVLGSPHNSPLVPGILRRAARIAALNVRRHLLGEPIAGAVRREDYEG